MIEKKFVIVRGGGDLASGTINRLYNMGFKVLILEKDSPNFIRRNVCYGEAFYEGEFQLEGVTSKLITSLEEIEKVWVEEKVPVYVDPEMKSVSELKPDILIDAIIAKKNLGMKKELAPLTIGLGPGFEAQKDVDIVIETNRGHNLGRIIREGKASENTGVPGIIKGYGKERVIYSPASGKIKVISDITSVVKKDEIIAYVDRTPVKATLTGIIRGMIRDGSIVEKGLKIGDIDPRVEEIKNCYTISDKARTISGGVVEGIFNFFLKGNANER